MVEECECACRLVSKLPCGFVELNKTKIMVTLQLGEHVLDCCLHMRQFVVVSHGRRHVNYHDKINARCPSALGNKSGGIEGHHCVQIMNGIASSHGLLQA